MSRTPAIVIASGALISFSIQLRQLMLDFFHKVMKLKLEWIHTAESQSSQTSVETAVLSVTEDIASEHLPVLKAGLSKLFQAGKKTILLDLTSLQPHSYSPPETSKEVSALHHWASNLGALLIIASPIPELGDAPDREAAIEKMKSPQIKLLSLEARIQVQIRALETAKAELQTRLSATQTTPTSDLFALRKENSALKERIAEMEALMKAYLARRAQPFSTETLSSKSDTASRVLVSALEQEGVLPVV